MRGSTANRILLVEDHAGMRDVLAVMMMSDPAFVLAAAEDGGEALDILARQQFDLVVLDLYLPDMSGAEVLRVIRAQYPRTRVVAITGPASGERAAVVDAFAGAADWFLQKPFDPEQLLGLIRQALSGSAVGRA